jgi:putative restriction endonuclease
MAHRDWTREELIVAFNLYCKIPFGKIHLRNPLVIELSQAIGRTPSAVSWKLANFARLDPALRKRNIAGAANGAKAEVQVWEEFRGDWERLAFESELLFETITGRVPEDVEEIIQFPAGKARETLIRARVNQGFFRAAVLAAYEVKCCITGLPIPELLNASHIVPWALDIKNRTNPRNGLCLNVIHDRAFDCGLLTITTDLTVKLSPKVRSTSADSAVRELLCRYDGVSVTVPRRFSPDPECLRFHNEHVFRNS